MTNEKFFYLFDDLVSKFDDYSINELRGKISSLRDYARDYLKNDDLTNQLRNASDIVYGDIQANPNEPKDIIISSRQDIDDSIINESAESSYYKEMDKKVVDEYLSKHNNEEKKEIYEEEKSFDNSKYIPGTNILKPRDRGIFETDEQYVKYLEEYYDKAFPNYKEKNLALVNDEPKGLAVLDDIKKPESIDNLEKAINNNSKEEEKKEEKKEDNLDFAGEEALDIDDIDSLDIFSNSDGTSASIAKEIEEEKKKNESLDKDELNSDDNSEEIEFDSEEEKEAFEKNQDIDYKKDKDSKTKKVSKIRKAVRKFKDVFKKHGKKIIAGILVATAAIGAAMSAKSCSYDKQEDLNENKDNPKSNTDEYGMDIPSVTVANSYGVDSSNINNSVDDDTLTSDDIKVDANASFNESDETYNVSGFDIGDAINFNGDSLYETSYNAANDIDPLKPYYSNQNDREISAIRVLSPDGKEAKTVTTKGEAKQLEEKGWRVESVNMKNIDHNTQFEGWTNLDDLSKVK